MRLWVQIQEEWLALSCGANQTIRSLEREILRRYGKKKGLDPDYGGLEISRILKSRCGTSLNPDDTVESVLDENDIIAVGRMARWINGQI